MTDSEKADIRAVPRHHAPMRMWWLGALVLIGCAPSREGYVKDHLVSAAHGEFTSLEDDLRLAVCGWRPDTKFEGAKVETTFVGDDKKGSAEAKAVFLPAKGAAAYGCEGTVAFDYEFRPARKSPAYYALSDVRRVGAAAPFVATMESKATPLALDAPANATFGEAWRLPDGAFGVAYRVDIVAAGPYRVAFTTRDEKRPRVVVYQKQMVVREGNRGGALGFWDLQPGPAWFFMHDTRTTAMEIRITSGQ